MVDILLQRWTATVGAFGFLAAGILFLYAWLMVLYVAVVLARLVATVAQRWHLRRRLDQIQRAAYDDPMRAHHVRLRSRFNRRAGEGENHAA